MKGTALVATLLVGLVFLSTACLAQSTSSPPNAGGQGPEGKAPAGWVLPFASQDMTDNPTPQKPAVTGTAVSRNRVKFDHISDDTPPNQGIAPQKSQK
jgi:hypothetical protein